MNSGAPNISTFISPLATAPATSAPRDARIACPSSSVGRRSLDIAIMRSPQAKAGRAADRLSHRSLESMVWGHGRDEAQLHPSRWCPHSLGDAEAVLPVQRVVEQIGHANLALAMTLAVHSADA